jgi:hypothetical protein
MVRDMVEDSYDLIVAAMPAAVRDGIADAVAHSLHTVFLVAAPVALVGFAVVLVLREVPLRDVVDRDDERVEPPDFDDFVSPACARCLLTVRAAISFARAVERPCFFSESLTCSYCRSRLLLQAF